MKPFRSGVLLVVAMTTLALTAGVTTGGAARTATPFRIAYFTEIAQNTYSTAFYNGVRAAAKKYGATVTNQFDAKSNLQTQVSQIQDVISAKQADGLVVLPVSGPPLIPVLTKAAKQGIKVGMVSSPLGKSYTSIKPPVSGVVTASAFTPIALIGKGTADILAKSCGNANPCNVFEMTGFPGYGYDVGFDSGFKAELKKYPKIKIVASALGGFAVAPALKATQNVLVAHSDLNAIVTDGDQMTHGAELALKSSTHTNKVALIAGGGASTYGVAAVKAGRWSATSITAPYSGGYFVAQALILAHEGKPVKNPYVTDSELVPGFAGQLFVTKQNAAKFKAQWAA